MEQDQIKEIGIDDKGRLYVMPLSKEFPYIYREAMEVHWDRENKFLYSPKPREWSYHDWFKQIIVAAKKNHVFYIQQKIPLGLTFQMISNRK